MSLSRTDSVREIEVQWGDLDSAGVVFYPHFFAWADAGTHQLFRAADLPMDRLLRERKISAVLDHDLRADLRSACRVVMQAHRVLPQSEPPPPSQVQIITPFNLPGKAS